MSRSVLAPLFGRVLTLQQQISQAVQAKNWDSLTQLDAQLQQCLQELAPYKPKLTAQQQQVLAQFAAQYRQLWQQVCEQVGELEQQLLSLRQQREGELAYDWVEQLGETS
ncbi:hypothetical protein [Oceanisphaera sp. W20_SRM_FM3]|uniref:hypothetical protein n=1 Tax=Oceanisphaera sp. W20_SRM_FM3 TaxID=3240267 RepID=UPI003F94ED98